jgi:hypothetical protein
VGFRVNSKAPLQTMRKGSGRGVPRRGFRRGRSEELVRVPRRVRWHRPIVGGAMTLVWGKVPGHCRRPIAFATRVVASRRERAEVEALATGLGREWWWPEGEGRRLARVEGASWAWRPGTHRGWIGGRAGIGVVALEDPKARMTNLHRSCLRRSPPKWRSDFVESEEVTSSATFDAGL